MYKKEFLTRGEIIKDFEKYKSDDSSENTTFTISCGRGYYMIFMRIFCDDALATDESPLLVKKELGISVGKIINKIYLPNIGTIIIEYNPKFDNPFKIREFYHELIGGLPDFSYYGEVFNANKESLGFVKMIKLEEKKYPTIDRFLENSNPAQILVNYLSRYDHNFLKNIIKEIDPFNEISQEKELYLKEKLLNYESRNR